MFATTRRAGRRSSRTWRTGRSQHRATILRYESLEARSLLNAAPITGADSYDVAVDSTLQVGEFQPAEPVTLIPAGATWKYFDTAANPPANWYSTNYDDSAWPAGPAELGYGDGDEATVISQSPNSQTPYYRSAFRHALTLDSADVDPLTSLEFRILRDDGVAVHLNDATEVIRDNLLFAQRAKSNVEDEDTYHSFFVDARRLVPGVNVVSADIRQSLGGLDDASFDLELIGWRSDTTAPQGVLANDSDPDGDRLFAEVATLPQNGTLRLNPNGSFTYAPNAGFSGSDTFSYRATDGNGGSATRTVNLTVRGYSPPVATPDHYEMTSGTTLEVSAAPVATPDGTVFDPGATYTGGGVFGLNSEGSSAVWGHRFSLQNHAHVTHVSAQLRNSTQHSPPGGSIFAALIALSGPDDVPDTFNLSSADVLATALLPVPDVQSQVTVPLDVQLSPGSYAILLGTGLFGANGIVVMPVAFTTPGPIGPYTFMSMTGSMWATHDQTALAVALLGDVVDVAAGPLANDVDAEGDAFTAQLVMPPTVGSLAFQFNGEFNYTPPEGFTGTVAFSYSVSDASGTSLPTTVTIDVSDAPSLFAADDQYSMVEDQSLIVGATNGVLLNDKGIAPVVEYLTGPEHGSVSLSADGSFIYVPTADYFGSDSFLYRLRDGGDLSAPATVRINVANTPDAPVAGGDAFTVPAGRTLPAGHDARAARYVYWMPRNTAHFGRTSIESGTGRFVERFYTPDPIGLSIDSFNNYAYFTDGNTGQLTRSRLDGSEQTVLIPSATIAACGCLPRGLDSALDRSAGKLYWIGQDYDTDERSSRLWRSNLDGSGLELLRTLPSNGPAYNLTLDLAAGKIYYTPGNRIERVDLDGSNLEVVWTAEGFDKLQGIAIDPSTGWLYVQAARSFGAQTGVYRVSADGAGWQPLVTNQSSIFSDLTLDVYARTMYWVSEASQVHRANLDGTGHVVLPHPASQYIVRLATDQVLNDNFTFPLTSNDVDADGDAVIAELVAPPAHGTVVVNDDGSFDYDPAPGYVGPDSFTYRVGDGALFSSPATVTLTVAGPIPGDLTNNGLVDRNDVAALVSRLGQPNTTWYSGDFDGDGASGLRDLILAQRNLAPAASAPGAVVVVATKRGAGSMLRATRQIVERAPAVDAVLAASVESGARTSIRAARRSR